MPLFHEALLVGGRDLDLPDGQWRACEDVEPPSGGAVSAIAGRKCPGNPRGCLVLGFCCPIFVDEPGAVQGRAGSVDESESGGFIVDVDDQPSVPETFFPDYLCCVAR